MWAVKLRGWRVKRAGGGRNCGRTRPSFALFSAPARAHARTCPAHPRCGHPHPHRKARGLAGSLP
eukprot:287181-Chlamydomonas_euryale.AAC.1